MEKIGLNYDTVCKLNPRIVYGEVTGYGKEGPWKNKPGQDLLAQAVSGLTWLTGKCRSAARAIRSCDRRYDLRDASRPRGSSLRLSPGAGRARVATSR